MFVGETDLLGRSIDVENSYVHDVYNRMSSLEYSGQGKGHRWPKINKFLNELEPGSTVCDVGCGNGKYLRVNSGVYKVGADICKKLTQVARDEDKEIVLCDNQALPFRDESFDAVLSIAVIHHFANRERRIRAIKELARILRVGGRLIITVWAMEQKYRAFGGQDVLMPCAEQKYKYNSSSLEVSTSTATSDEDFGIPIHIPVQLSHPKYFTSSKRDAARESNKSRLQLFRSLKSIKNSPTSSTLSSPNETCYSFVRKALQKLSGSSKKQKQQSGRWFVDSLSSLSREECIPDTRYDPEGCEQGEEDLQHLPIEIIHMDKELVKQKSEKLTAYQQLLEVLNLPQKSRSMNDIPQLQVPSLTRPRSSVSGLEASSSATQPKWLLGKQSSDTLKPRLVKQKTSLCEQCDESDQIEQSFGSLSVVSGEEITTTITATSSDAATDEEATIARLLDDKSEKFNVYKQRSLTDEILFADRLKEKEQVKLNIQKQASLNEELFYHQRHKTSLDAIKDSFFSTSAAKKLQLFRTGLTSKLKNSTSSIEKIAGNSIKSGFARIFQNLTGTNSTDDANGPYGDNFADQTDAEQQQYGNDEDAKRSSKFRKSSSEDKGSYTPSDERRCSHEENNSDSSSKDNSLQSDTSVDSEDSVISVIERKPMPSTIDQLRSPSAVASPICTSPKLALTTAVLSHPSSPKVSLQYSNQKGKALSLPASPRNLIASSGNLRQISKILPATNGNKIGGTKPHSNGGITDTTSFTYDHKPTVTSDGEVSRLKFEEEGTTLLKLSPIGASPENKLKIFSDQDVQLLSEKLTLLSEKKTASETEPRGDICEGDESEKSDVEPDLVDRKKVINQVKSFEGSSNKTTSLSRVYALIRRSATGPGSSVGHAARLPSYELFNPETEDVETDSSGVSTPDSFGSVISVKIEDSQEHDQQPQSDEIGSDDLVSNSITLPTSTSSEIFSPVLLPPTTTVATVVSDTKTDPSSKSVPENDVSNKEEPADSSNSAVEPETEDAPSSSTETEIITGELRPITLQPNSSTESASHQPSRGRQMKSPIDESWGNECRQYLVEFAENLSEKLLAEIDRYKELEISPMPEVPDPYLRKLSEELHHVSKLSRELSQDYDTKSCAGGAKDEPSKECEEKKHVGTTLLDTPEVRIEELKTDTELVSPPSQDKTNENDGTSVERTPPDTVLISQSSTEAESPINGWLDSRRNTIESKVHKADDGAEGKDDGEPGAPGQTSATLDVEQPLNDTVRRRSSSGISTKELPDSTRKLSNADIVQLFSNLQRRASAESTDTVDISNRTFSSEDSGGSKIKPDSSNRYSLESDVSIVSRSSDTSKHDKQHSGSRSSQISLHPSASLESSDACDISDRTGSDLSRQNTETRSIITQSSASLASDCSKDIRFADRRMARCDGRSSSEETNSPRGAILIRQKAAINESTEKNEGSADISLSESTSQDSLISEGGGGSMTIHCYYHVFKEGELDQLIHEYVQNLHIISSYYDHSNWCVIAEKVQVWTI